MEGFGRAIVDEADAQDVESERVRRDSLFLTARLRLAGAATVHEVRVRNLSPGGVMVELDQIVDPGVAVTLEMRGLGQLTGQIAWCTRGRIGVALDRPIDPRKARMPVGGGATTPDYAKPLSVTFSRRRRP